MCILTWKLLKNLFKPLKRSAFKAKDRSFEIQSAAPQTDFSRGGRGQAYAAHYLCRIEGLFQFFEQSLIERITCQNEVDREILRLLFEAGSSGLFPKDLAVKLERSRSSHQISRRLLRMNKRLEKEFGEHVAEQRGWHWALTSFATDAWGATEEGS